MWSFLLKSHEYYDDCISIFMHANKNHRTIFHCCSLPWFSMSNVAPYFTQIIIALIGAIPTHTHTVWVALCVCALPFESGFNRLSCVNLKKKSKARHCHRDVTICKILKINHLFTQKTVQTFFLYIYKLNSKTIYFYKSGYF